MNDGLIMSIPLARERMKNVTINWSYPRLLANMWYDEQMNNIGLYYISRKFGTKETLLYIGQTYDCYYNRLASHNYWWLSYYRGNKYVRLGEVICKSVKSDEDMRQLIKDVEGALIYEMRDMLRENIMGIRSYSPRHLYRIMNTGYRGELSATVSMRDHCVEDV